MNVSSARENTSSTVSEIFPAPGQGPSRSNVIGRTSRDDRRNRELDFARGCLVPQNLGRTQRVASSFDSRGMGCAGSKPVRPRSSSSRSSRSRASPPPPAPELSKLTRVISSFHPAIAPAGSKQARRRRQGRPRRPEANSECKGDIHPPGKRPRARDGGHQRALQVPQRASTYPTLRSSTNRAH